MLTLICFKYDSEMRILFFENLKKCFGFFFSGVRHSYGHSTVAFGPELFCNLSVYYDQFGSSASLIQDALNNDRDVEKTCVITPAARCHVFSIYRRFLSETLFHR